MLDEWKRVAQQPFGSKFVDTLSLLSPYTWWRVSVLRGVKDFLPTVTSSIVALTLPAAFGWLIISVCGCTGKRIRLQRPSVSFPPYWFTCVFSFYSVPFCVRIARKMKEVGSHVLTLYRMKSCANPEAWKYLSDRIKEGRSYRTRQYDVYLPPLSSPKITAPVLFLPGAFVEHVAYSGICSLLSDAGFLVVVVSMEPLRHADGYLAGSSATALRKIQQQIEKNHSSCLISLTTEDKISRWILAGHSMGALIATKLVDPLKISKLIMLGVAPFVDFLTDISKSPCKVQVIQGSNDYVIKEFSTPELECEFWQRLPPECKNSCYTIAGGTHSGFANYTSWYKAESCTISREAQQAEVVREVIKFLK